MGMEDLGIDLDGFSHQTASPVNLNDIKPNK